MIFHRLNWFAKKLSFLKQASQAMKLLKKLRLFLGPNRIAEKVSVSKQALRATNFELSQFISKIELVGKKLEFFSKQAF